MPAYTPAEVDTLLAKMAQERATLFATVRTLSDAQARRAPPGAVGEAQWSPKEQLAHLWEMERSYVAWVRRALQEDGADLTGIRGEPVAIPLDEASTHGVPEFVAALREERAGTLALIESLPLPAFARTARSPIFGELMVMQWLRSFYRHDRQHSAQIQGRESDYRPRFLAGREPDQRRQRAP